MSTISIGLGHLPGLSAQTLESYIRTAQSAPVLTEEAERGLARRLRQEGDIEAVQALVLSHLRLVVALARRYLGYGLPYPDLIQEGNVGLMKAVRRFDPDRGVRLASYAIRWITAEIQEYALRNWRLVKIATTKAERKLFFNLRSKKSAALSLSAAEIGRIAGELRVTPADVVEMDMRLSARDLPLEGGKEADGPAPADFLAADTAWQPPAALEAKEQEQRAVLLRRAVAGLDFRSRRIVQSRWLSGDRKTPLRELAAKLEISIERVRQIEEAALRKMRRELQATAPSDRPSVDLHQAGPSPTAV